MKRKKNQFEGRKAVRQTSNSACPLGCLPCPTDSAAKRRKHETRTRVWVGALCFLHSCWLGDRKNIRPQKNLVPFILLKASCVEQAEEENLGEPSDPRFTWKGSVRAEEVVAAVTVTV